MAREASATMTVILSAILRDTATTRLSTPQAIESFDISKTFSTGTADGQFDRVYSKSDTISASGTAAFDLAGALTDGLGQTITMAEIVAIAISNDATVAGVDIQVGAGSNPLSTLFGNTADYILLKPGGFHIYSSYYDGGGYAVTGGLADTLTLTNASGSTAAPYTIWIAGRSA